MTTIACDGISMASDGLITSGDTIIATDVPKVFKLNDGRLIGFAGNAYTWEDILNYFNSDDEKKVWPKLDNDISIIILDLLGRITLYDHNGRSFQRPAPTAIGSGRSFAIAAMDAGLEPDAAVAIACKRDTLSGGTIRVMTISYELDQAA